MALTCGSVGAPGRIRTCDTRFRKPLLYPLSYEGAIAQSSDRAPFGAGGTDGTVHGVPRRGVSGGVTTGRR
jgi:hypothetical protein